MNPKNEQLAYDLLGNRLTFNTRADDDVVYTHNTANEYTAIDAVSVSYDYAGNLSEDPNGYEYEYDHDNRLTKVTKDASTVAEYSYDALGRRVEFVDPVADVTRRYYYDGWRVLTETVDDGDETRYDYTYGNYLDEVLARSTDGSTSPMWYLHDHLFSPVALANAGGSLVQRIEYDVYGQWHLYDPDFSEYSGSDLPNAVAFTGQRLDWLDNGDLVVMYYKNRYYLLESGRFVQRDPFGVQDSLAVFQFEMSGRPWFPREFNLPSQAKESLDLYEYVMSNPCGYRDGYGLDCHCFAFQGAKTGAHRMLQCKSNNWGFVPWKGTPWENEQGSPKGPMDPSLPPDAPHKPGDDTKPKGPRYAWVLKKRSSGYLAFSRGGSQIPCKCATCDDIIDCIKRFTRHTWDKNTKYNIVKYNCRDWVSDAIHNCCLRYGTLHGPGMQEIRKPPYDLMLAGE